MNAKLQMQSLVLFGILILAGCGSAPQENEAEIELFEFEATVMSVAAGQGAEFVLKEAGSHNEYRASNLPAVFARDGARVRVVATPKSTTDRRSTLPEIEIVQIREMLTVS